MSLLERRRQFPEEAVRAWPAAARRRRIHGCGAVGRSNIVAAKDRGPGPVTTKVVTGTDAYRLRGFVTNHTARGDQVFTDDAEGRVGMRTLDVDPIAA